jgi:CRISPR-associated protein (TIGR03986 family)
MSMNNADSEERRARAPYNFIPLPTKVVKAQELPNHDKFEVHSERYSGKIICELVTKTPMYTRTMMTSDLFERWQSNSREVMADDDARKKIAQFYSYGSRLEPIIPGSTLRGMLRSIIEIITFSKVEWVTDKKLVYRAVGDRTSLGDEYRKKLLGKKPGALNVLNYPNSSVKGGYLRRRNGAWWIQPAEEHLGESFVHVDYSVTNSLIHSYGHHKTYDVYVFPEARFTSNRGERGGATLYLDIAISTRLLLAGNGVIPPKGYEFGKLVETGQMGAYPPRPGQHPKHMHCVIYGPDNKISTEDWLEISEGIWDLYSEDLEISRERINTPRRLTDGEPLFYLVENGRVAFFGPTMMFRLPYPRSPYEFIPDVVKDPDVVDMTDAIFGYIRQNALSNKLPQHYAGRIKVSDAKFSKAENQLWMSDIPITPKILASPKPTTFQHYLEQDHPDDRRALRHYATGKNADIKIRGNKLYWNTKDFDYQTTQDAVEDWNHDTQHTQIRPINSGVHFSFSIVFENLTSEELGALLWALSPPGKRQYCYKIGMAKPLGYGSIAIHPKLLLDNRKDRYTNLFDENCWNEGLLISDEDFIKKFESHMKTELEIEGNFRYQERVQMLLAMLAWPGLPSSSIEYQSLPDFRDRPVLPDPLFIYQHEANEEENKGEDEGIISVDATVTAVVIDDTELSGDLWTNIEGFNEEIYIGHIKKKNARGRNYQEGSKVRCTVIDVKQEGDETIVELLVTPRDH